MTPEYVAVSRGARASEAIAAIRSLVDQAETVSYVYVVDAERHLLGVSRSTGSCSAAPTRRSSS
jgi:magnesium transporter